MIYFPVTTVTDCFDNPDEIVKFANTLKYYKSKTGNFPNIRHSVERGSCLFS